MPETENQFEDSMIAAIDEKKWDNDFRSQLHEYFIKEYGVRDLRGYTPSISKGATTSQTLDSLEALFCDILLMDVSIEANAYISSISSVLKKHYGNTSKESFVKLLQRDPLLNRGEDIVSRLEKEGRLKVKTVLN